MKSLGEHRAAAAERAIHGPCDPRADGHHATTEGSRIRRLDHEMRVRALQCIVNEAEMSTRANGGEAALERTHERNRAERWQSGPEPHGHVDRMTCGDALAAAVRNAGIRPTLASGTRPSAAPPADVVKTKRQP